MYSNFREETERRARKTPVFSLRWLQSVGPTVWRRTKRADEFRAQNQLSQAVKSESPSSKVPNLDDMWCPAKAQHKDLDLGSIWVCEEDHTSKQFVSLKFCGVQFIAQGPTFEGSPWCAFRTGPHTAFSYSFDHAHG